MTDTSYQAKIGCWNCDRTYEILVKRGIFTSQHLIEKKVQCKFCGCDSLRPFEDYRINKKIMKDLVLQTRLEEGMHEHGEDRDSNDHQHYK